MEAPPHRREFLFVSCVWVGVMCDVQCARCVRVFRDGRLLARGGRATAQGMPTLISTHRRVSPSPSID